VTRMANENDVGTGDTFRGDIDQYHRAIDSIAYSCCNELHWIDLEHSNVWRPA
jgi:hypothetical protein